MPSDYDKKIIQLLKQADCLVVDVDGTLVVSGPSHIISHQKAAKYFGITVPCEDLEAMGGFSSRATFDAIAAKHPNAGLDFERYEVLKDQYFLEDLANKEVSEPGFVIKGMPEVLMAAKDADITIIAATNSRLNNVTGVLQAAGIFNLFDAIYAPDDFPAKPDPAMLRAAINKYGGNTVFIGDTVQDGQAAFNAHVPFILTTAAIRDANKKRERIEAVRAVNPGMLAVDEPNMLQRAIVAGRAARDRHPVPTA